MAEPLGKPFALPRPQPVTNPDTKTLGYGWEPSEGARRDIEEIEMNVRQAEQKAGAIFVR